jgi:hypothetical protein
VIRYYGGWTREDSYTEVERKQARARREQEPSYLDLAKPLGQALLGCVAAAIATEASSDSLIAALNEIALGKLACTLHHYRRSP